MLFPRCLAVVLGLSAIASSARGAAPDDDAGAERLFQEAKGLMAEGRVHDACSKLEEAKRLEVGGGIILALAVCHEKDGRGASALSDFQEALALAIEARRADRVRLAETRIAKLRESVSTLTLTVSEGTDLRVNGEPWGPARIGVAVPVNGGDYAVRAEAPGKKPWETTLHLGAERDSRRLEVPPLADTEGPSPPAGAVLLPRQESVVQTETARGVDGRHARRVAGLAVGAFGVVGLGASAAFAVLAVSKRRDADCGGHVCAGATGTYDSAQTAANVATVAAIAGAGGVAAGALLLLTSRTRADAAPGTASVQLVPQLSPSGGWIGIAGRF